MSKQEIIYIINDTKKQITKCQDDFIKAVLNQYVFSLEYQLKTKKYI